MNLKKRAIRVFTLTSVFGMALAANVPNTLACSPTDGIMQTPPCASAVLVTEDPRAPEQREISSASNTLDVTSAVEDALITFLLF